MFIASGTHFSLLLFSLHQIGAKSAKFQVNFNGINNEIVDNESYDNDNDGGTVDRFRRIHIFVATTTTTLTMCVSVSSDFKRFKRGK